MTEYISLKSQFKHDLAIDLQLLTEYRLSYMNLSRLPLFLKEKQKPNQTKQTLFIFAVKCQTVLPYLLKDCFLQIILDPFPQLNILYETHLELRPPPLCMVDGRICQKFVTATDTGKQQKKEKVTKLHICFPLLTSVNRNEHCLHSKTPIATVTC